MNEVSAAMAKLAGIRRAVNDLLVDNQRTNPDAARFGELNYGPNLVQHYFFQALTLISTLRVQLPDLYGDLQPIETSPHVEMAAKTAQGTPVMHYGHKQLKQLVRDIDQIFEIRANSELDQPKPEMTRRVFITHGRSNDWRAVQAFIEKDVQLATIELAQEPAEGRTIIEKLEDNASRCGSAVIVMTGDDVANAGEPRVRENVMHEIGFFQGRYGRKAVVLLHEEGVNIPTNLAGLVYVPFPKGNIEAGFHVLQRELKALYK